MSDLYWWGEVARISPEAPVPVVRVVREEKRDGAAYNVGANIRSMGCLAITCVCPTSRKIRLVARNQQVARIDFDETPTDQKISFMEQAFVDYLRDVDMVVFSDYGKGSLRSVQDLIYKSKSAGKQVFVDPKGYDYSRYAGADLIKPNTEELRNLVGGWISVEQMNRKAEALRLQAKVGAILLTRAAEGMVLYNSDGAHFIKSIAREVYDVTGAGDTAIAAFAVAVSRGLEFPEAAWYANKAAGIVCGKFGTSIATEEEVFGTG